ncbi:uncharacterized protein LOC131223290 [Magnolia sinica]|uniref:uncharacterized protein LOC131223290 n=1 Tax=Magnolia sinica TaxID=86752 RepID=UPI0026582CEE|nr:uncharacterized protein LOC131223290 [Magnolia sinica]
MKILCLVLHVWTLGVLMFFSFTSSYKQYEPQSKWDVGDDSSFSRGARFSEVEKECGSVISSSVELNSNPGRWNSVRDELSFMTGAWWQEGDSSPLMPFVDRDDVPKNKSGLSPLLHLVSFTAVDVDRVHRFKNMVNVSGILNLFIYRDIPPEWSSSMMLVPAEQQEVYSQSPVQQSPEFLMHTGDSRLTITFDGIYVESEKNGGERVLCLLGSATLPSRQPDSTDPWEWVKHSNPNHYQPRLLQDDRILLILRYPQTFTLTTRAIHGEMKSLNEESNLRYFDKVYISSQLGAYSNYEFGSKKLISKACDPYPYGDDVINGQVEIYKGFGFCGILERFLSEDPFTVVPNWKCNGTDEYCSKLGPFVSGGEIKATDGGFKNVKLVTNGLRCEPGHGEGNVSSARMSAVFRAVGPFGNVYTESRRTSLTNMTLSAEGIWNSSVGQVCMVGCLGNVDASVDGCNSRICLYIPISFSITRRSIIFGTISSISNSADSFFPLSFEKLVRPSELWNSFSTSHLSYKYSKIELAGAFLERSEPFDFRTVIKKSLLSYPALEDGDELVSLSLLSEDLTLHGIPAVPDPVPKVRSRRPFIEMEVISIGPLFGRYWPSSENVSTVDGEVPFRAKAESTEEKLLLNVSAQLRVIGEPYTNVSELFLEGLYNPIVGKMYLIGCRDVRASWDVLFESRDLEGGLDCLIDVKVEYPPKTARWLMNPTVKISINSQRNDDDPLHFSPINLMTLPIMYRKQREDILSRKGVEGILRILTLSVAIACILGQLFYIRDKVNVIPFISLVMLVVQALGYSLPLITGAEALFAQMSSEPYESQYYDLKRNQKFRVIDYMVKFLVLVAFLLTLRLFQKVWKSRIRLLTRAPLEPGRVPSDRRVLFASLVIHTVGFLIIIVVHMVDASKRPLQSEKYTDVRGNSHKLREWETELEEYVGLVQDFFLLPQIIGNVLWQIDCKPLRKVYYIGVTVVRLLPHIYDYIRAPVFNPYFSEEYEFVNPDLDFFSKFGDIAIPTIATLLAIIVYIQQRWSYRELSEKLRSGECKFLPLGSRVYERLPSKSFEAELVSGVNESSTHSHLQQDEE